MHDVVVGMWTPRAHETTAGLKSNDFCTNQALVTAMKQLKLKSGDFTKVTDKPWGAKVERTCLPKTAETNSVLYEDVACGPLGTSNVTE
jgi:hypothetical protein